MKEQLTPTTTTPATSIESFIGTTADSAIQVPGGQVTGLEYVSQEDLGTPTVSLIQDRSRYVDKRHAQADVIEGLEPGDLLMTPTRIPVAKHPGFVYVIPIFYRKVWIEMKPRNMGGGFVKSHAIRPMEAMDTTDKEGRRRTVIGPNELVETANMLCRFFVNGKWEPAYFRMTSTALACARVWLSTATSLRGALYAHAYKLSTKLVPGKPGSGSYFVPVVAHAGPVKDQALFNSSKDLAEAALELSGAQTNGRTQVLADVSDEEHV